MEKSINKKLYNLDDTEKGFYTKENEISISKRWDQKAKYWEQQLFDKNCHLNRNKEYDYFIKVTKELINKLLSNSRNKAFIDIGCGTGLVSKEIHSYFERGVGIDISAEMIKEAKKKNLKNVSFFKKSLFQLLEDNNKYDLVVSRGILLSHYGLEYLNEFFEIFYHITESGGIVVFDFLNKKAVDEGNYHLPKNKEYFERSTISEYALSWGFRKVDIKGKDTDRVLIGVLYK